ncbi:MAG: hypothetical protein A2Y79_12190 [Deltaproteobacteria bacterium RBG_13_43_22]|nr:MAG: hypothetical protein A2Y79_12190 [Deltaproteobacteria bacterium RBG_13_43_22]
MAINLFVKHFLEKIKNYFDTIFKSPHTGESRIKYGTGTGVQYVCNHLIFNNSGKPNRNWA